MRLKNKEITIWILYGIFLFAIFLLFTDYGNALINTVVTVGIQVFIYYLNLYYIIPKYYEKRFYYYYAISNLTLIIIGFIISEGAEELYKMKVNAMNYDDEIHHKTLLSHTIPCLLSIFISFFVHTFKKQKLEDEKQLNLLSAEKDFLIQQINPHFLFNSLNNIYSLTLDNDKRGSDAILHLSQMLDYSIYSGQKKLVSITEEIDYIKNFINLFKIKDDEIENIIFNYKVEYYSMIAPMLLIPFIENAFKHGDIESNKNGKIKIELTIEDNKLKFECVNTFNKEKSVDKTGGIGVQNVTRRLELLYPKQHKLLTDQNNDLYTVFLKIRLDEKI